jgi:FixJ family two-component response regulator
VVFVLAAGLGALLPDVAIIDVRMPPTHTDEGLRAAQAIHADHPEVGVLVFSQYIETRSAAELFAGAPAGVSYLLKDRVADVGDFIEAISRVAHGGTVLDPEVVRQLLRASRRADSLATLTPREKEVLSLMAQGRSNTAIAGALVISPPGRGEARRRHLCQARPRPLRRRQPPGHRRHQIPGVVTAKAARARTPGPRRVRAGGPPRPAGPCGPARR